MLDTLSIVKTPGAARKLFPAALWKVRTRAKKLFLTFDDGPTEGVTPAVLDELKKYGAKATFFCIGKNIRANPALYRRILEEGHSVGNHTEDHFNGWHTENALYFENVEKCAESMAATAKLDLQAFCDKNGGAGPDQCRFFRPPYGKLSLLQYQHLKKFYKIVMWDVLSFDFDLKVSREQVLENVLQSAVPGSVVVFHDSLKAADKVLYALPRLLGHFAQLGFKFESLPEA